MITIFFDKINSLVLKAFLAIVFIFPLSANAAGDALTGVNEIFRRQLLSSVGDSFLNNGLLDWSGNSFLKYLFGFCFVIAIFQVVYRHYGTSSFLLEWVKIPVFAFIALSILGGSTAYTAFFNHPYPTHNQKIAKKTLDKDIYYFLADKFDALASQLDRVAGPSIYKYESAKFFVAIKNIQIAIAGCSPSNKACLLEKLTLIDTDNSEVLDNHNKDLGFYDTVKYAARRILELLDILFQPLPFWLIYVIIWILDLLRVFINYFTLLVFSLITSISLFFCKIFTIFLVLPDFRGKVWNAYKMPMSATMYGFLTSLIIAMSTAIVRGINDATVNTLITQLKINNELTAMDAIQVLFGSTLSTAAILGIQILSMSKVPGLCRKLWDLQLEELAEFGKSVIQAGLGALKMAGGAALTVATAGAGAAIGGAAAMGGAMSGGAGMMGGLKAGFSGAASGAKNSLMNSISGSGPGGLRGLVGLTDAGSGAAQGGGAGGDSIGSVAARGASIGGVGGGAGGSGDSSSSSSSFGGGGGGGGSSAGSGGRIGLKKVSKKEEEKDPETKMNELKKKNRWDTAEAALGGLKSVGKGLGVLAGAGINAAMGREFDPMSLLSSGTRGATMGIAGALSQYSENKAAKQQLERENMDSLGNLDAKSSASFEVKEDEAKDLSSKISSGTAQEDDFKKFNQMVNNGDRSKLSQEVQEQIKSAQENQSFQDWSSNLESKIQSATRKAAVYDSDGNVKSINYSKAGDLINMMNEGYVTRGSIASNLDMQGILKTNKQDRLNQLDKMIAEQTEGVNRAKKSNRVSDQTKHERMVQSLQTARSKIDNGGDQTPNSYVSPNQSASTSQSSTTVDSSGLAGNSMGTRGSSSDSTNEENTSSSQNTEATSESKNLDSSSQNNDTNSAEVRVEENNQFDSIYQSEMEKLVNSDDYKKMSPQDKAKVAKDLAKKVRESLKKK